MTLCAAKLCSIRSVSSLLIARSVDLIDHPGVPRAAAGRSGFLVDDVVRREATLYPIGQQPADRGVSVGQHLVRVGVLHPRGDVARVFPRDLGCGTEAVFDELR